MKKILIIAITLLFVGLVPHVFAETQGFTALAPIPNLTDANSAVANSSSLANFFNNLYKYLIGLAAVLTVIVIIYEGIKIATNKENVSSLMDSKSRIWQAIIGLALVLSPVLVFSIINPSILNLSLNLPVLDTATRTGNGGGTPTQTPTVVDANGCTVHEGEFLETAVCPTNIASDYNCKNGLNPTIQACKTFNAQGKENCAVVSIYCGLTVTVTYYHATYHLVGKVGGDGTVVPRDAIAQNTFSSGCSDDGGKMDVEKLFVFSDVFTSPGNCPEDANVPDYTPTFGQTGFTCYDRKLVCRP